MPDAGLIEPDKKAEKFSRLAVKQTRIVILLAIVIGSAMSLVQIMLDANHLKSSFRDTSAELARYVEGAAATAAYRLDAALARQVLDSLLLNVDVQGAMIQDDFGDELARVSTAQQRELSVFAQLFFSYDVTKTVLELNHPNKADGPVGQLIVEILPYSQVEGFEKRAVSQFFTGTLKSALLSLILLYVFHRMVTRRAVEMEQKVRQVSLGYMDPKNDQKLSKADELDHLFATAMDMITRFQDATELNRISQQALNAAACGVFISDATKDNEAIYVNPRFLEITGYDQSDVLSRNCRFLNQGTADKKDLDAIRNAIKESEPVTVTIKNRRKDGTLFWNRLSISPIKDSRGKTTHFVGIQEDITAEIASVERMRSALDALLKSSQRLELAQDAAQFGIWEYDFKNSVIVWDKKMHEIYGVPVGEFAGRVKDWRACLHPDDCDKVFEAIRDEISSGDSQQKTFRIFRASDGEERIISANSIVVMGPDGIASRFLGISRDVTEETKAAADLLRFGRVVEASKTEVYLFDVFTLKFVQVSQGACENLGYTHDEMLRLTPLDIKPDFDEASFRQMIEPIQSGKLESTTFETPHRRKDGSLYPTRIVLQYVDDEASPVFLAVVRDISERSELEKKLLRSQRLEAVGKLTGGIAHDFNNILHVISGNAQLLEIGLGDALQRDALLQRQLSKIQSSVESGAALTSRLLAFARRDTLAPEVVHVETLLSEVSDVLDRTLGEDIELRVAVAPDLPDIFVDKHQLENAVINLGINSRDAMPNGGMLIVDAALSHVDPDHAALIDEVPPGDYVTIAVADTGTGIPKDILDQVIEPFFTTKDVGKGTGLGLSMVYGFVQQSGGVMNIYSEDGEGTVVRLYLPIADPHAVSSTNDIKSIISLNSERILLVEDDPNVREISVATLRGEGLIVTEAGDARTALSHLREHGDAFDLLFTDIVLPGGMSGLELAKEAIKIQPDIKVLFTSGYTERFVNPDDGLKLGENLLRKPYMRADLLTCLSNLLRED